MPSPFNSNLARHSIASALVLMGLGLLAEARFPTSHGREVDALMLDETFWLGLMPYFYHVGLVVCGLGLLINRNGSVLVSFFIAAMTIEEILVGFISSQPVPFSPLARISLMLAGMTALAWILHDQKNRPESKHIGFQLVWVGIAVGVLISVGFEVFFGPQAVSDPLAALRWTIVPLSIANGTSPLWMQRFRRLPRTAIAALIWVRPYLNFVWAIGFISIAALTWSPEPPELSFMFITLVGMVTGWIMCFKIQPTADQLSAQGEVLNLLKRARPAPENLKAPRA
jgi:hypothetical protein